MERGFAGWKGDARFVADEGFVAELIATAGQDQATWADAQSASDAIVARLAWNVGGRIFQAGQYLFALMEALTGKQELSDHHFATGSLIVGVRATGQARALPTLDEPDADEKVEQVVRAKVEPLLTLISTGAYQLSIRTVPSDGRQPRMWAPSRREAAAFLVVPVDPNSQRLRRRVVLKGTDPDAQGSGYARLQFHNVKETIKATLSSRHVAMGWVVGNEYDAELMRHQNGDVISWDLIELRIPDEADRPSLRTFHPTELPPVSDLGRLAEFLVLVGREGSTKAIQPATFSVQEKATIAYWARFAETLGAVDAHGALTADGSLAEVGGRPVLKRLFVRSRVANALRVHAGRSVLRDITDQQVREFVEASVPGVTGTTLDQRVAALLHLVKECSDAE